MSKSSKQTSEKAEPQASDQAQARERGVVYLVVGIAKSGVSEVIGIYPGMGSAMKAYASSMREAMANGIELSVLKCHELVGTTIRQTARPPKAE